MRWQELSRKLGPVGLLGLFWLVVPALLGLYMVARLAVVVELLAGADGKSILLFTALMGLVIGLGILPVYSNTVLCGWVFGLGIGCASALGSYLLAALIGYRLSYRLAYRRIHSTIEEHPSAQRVRHALVYDEKRRTFVIVLLWRLSGSPFPLTNFVMAGCGVPLGPYLLGTLAGLAPRVLIGTFIASTAAQSGAHDVQTLIRQSQHPLLLFIGALASLLFLGLIGHIARTALRRLAGVER